MNRSPAAAFVIWLLALTAVRPATAEVELVRGASPDSIRVVADGELRAVMQTHEIYAKPFLYPVLQPGWSGREQRVGRYILADTIIAKGEHPKFAIPAGWGSQSPPAEKLSLDSPGGVFVPASALAVREMYVPQDPDGNDRPEGYDHPHHRGIWIAVDEVADTTFWSEGGVIDVVSADILQSQGNPAVLRLNTRWLANSKNDSPEDDRVVLQQSTLWSFYDDGFIGTETVFAAPPGESITFGDTKEGLLGVRMPDDSREKSGGLIRSSVGTTDEENVWGREWPWVDYAAPADDQNAAAARRGIAMFDHPANPRPSRYHVRGYGLFAINPFGPAAYTDGEQPADPVTLSGDDTLTLRYGIWVHGNATPEQIADRGRQFIKATTSAAD